MPSPGSPLIGRVGGVRGRGVKSSGPSGGGRVETLIRIFSYMENLHRGPWCFGSIDSNCGLYCYTVLVLGKPVDSFWDA